MKIFILSMAIFLLIFATEQTLYSYDKDRAKANLASDFAECAAYYSLTAEGLKRSGKDVSNIMEALKVAYNYASAISNQQVTEARIKLSLDEQNELMQRDFSNFSILIEKYGLFCKKLLENPEDRLQYWLDKK